MNTVKAPLTQRATALTGTRSAAGGSRDACETSVPTSASQKEAGFIVTTGGLLHMQCAALSTA